MRQWTSEERLRQSQLIRNWQPWEKSTGAKTAAGKAVSKMNAYKHGGRSAETIEIMNIFSHYKHIRTMLN
jgi:hypothetical protein